MRWIPVALALLATSALASAQAPQRVASGKADAKRDLTGYWVSVVTGENWHLRMTVPPKGQFALIPLNAEGRRVANTWDSKVASAAVWCKPYGAANIMSVPGRLHIHWADDNTLQIDTDAGRQTRLLQFGTSPSGKREASWQGQSTARWASGDGRGGRTKGDTLLTVTTSGLRAGHLRKNGVPYSELATLEEYFDAFTEPNGDSWLVVTSVVTDPKYLTRPYMSVVQFKKLPDASGWDPTSCNVNEPR